MAIFTYEYKIRYTDVGSDNKLTLKALVSTLQEAAILHSEHAGYGVNNSDETHLAWLLLNWKVQVFSYPHTNQVITIKTWPRIFDKLYALFPQISLKFTTATVTISECDIVVPPMFPRHIIRMPVDDVRIISICQSVNIFIERICMSKIG